MFQLSVHEQVGLGDIGICRRRRDKQTAGRVPPAGRYRPDHQKAREKHRMGRQSVVEMQERRTRVPPLPGLAVPIVWKVSRNISERPVPSPRCNMCNGRIESIKIARSTNRTIHINTCFANCSRFFSRKKLHSINQIRRTFRVRDTRYAFPSLLKRVSSLNITCLRNSCFSLYIYIYNCPSKPYAVDVKIGIGGYI